MLVGVSALLCEKQQNTHAAACFSRCKLAPPSTGQPSNHSAHLLLTYIRRSPFVRSSGRCTRGMRIDAWQARWCVLSRQFEPRLHYLPRRTTATCSSPHDESRTTYPPSYHRRVIKQRSAFSQSGTGSCYVCVLPIPGQGNYNNSATDAVL